ncbi:MAG: hypothetical protein II661_09960, partial [Bacteroidales bacterium]|nr:hypothetical protein [Bacteroidales bacterium]
NSSISENVSGRFIRAAILAAQDIAYRGIVGDTLLAKLKGIVENDSTDHPAAAPYVRLLDKSRYFLLYSTLVELLPLVNNKVANAGVVKTPDEKVEVSDQTDLITEISRYQGKADHEAQELQYFLLNNVEDYPELNEGEYHRIHSNLYSAASCNVFLGGARGKRIGPGGDKSGVTFVPTPTPKPASFDKSFDTSYPIYLGNDAQ